MSIGTGYDLGVSTFSPDGRVFQVEYAGKAVDNSGTIIGVKCSDGIVMGVEKILLSRMLVAGTNRRIHNVDKHAGMAMAGLVADGRIIANRAQEESASYKQNYGVAIPGQILADRVSGFFHVFTLYDSVRPFGCASLLAIWDTDGPALYSIEPNGEAYRYFGCALGKAKQQAKTMIESLKLEELTCRQAVFEVAKMIHQCHDDVKDKAFELEMSWVCEESGKMHRMVPAELVAEAETAAKAALEESDDDDDDDDDEAAMS